MGFNVITYEQAKDILMRVGASFPTQTIQKNILDAQEHVVAQDIAAPMDVPSFDNAAMDGFAVRFQDVLGASSGKPVVLQKKVVLAAGDFSSVPLKQGECFHIMTGAPVPEGANAIVPVEKVLDQGGDYVAFGAEAVEGAHIRRRGEDFIKGSKIIEKGRSLALSHIMPLAALGISHVHVFRKPRVVFIATGRELVDDLSQPLHPGQIYNCNRPYAVAFLKQLGCDVTASYTLPDDEVSFKKLLEDILVQDVDFIVSSGAVSAGKFDFVRSVLEEMGAEILYHKVKIKPGKPNLFAQFSDGRAYFGLPGNPVATAVGLRFFVYPFIRAMLGLTEERGIPIKIASSYNRKPSLQLFQKALLSCSLDGNLEVKIFEGQESFMLHPFLEMNAWAVIPEGDDPIKPTDKINVFPLCVEKNIL